MKLLATLLHCTFITLKDYNTWDHTAPYCVLLRGGHGQQIYLDLSLQHFVPGVNINTALEVSTVQSSAANIGRVFAVRTVDTGDNVLHDDMLQSRDPHHVTTVAKQKHFKVCFWPLFMAFFEVLL